MIRLKWISLYLSQTDYLWSMAFVHVHAAESMQQSYNLSDSFFLPRSYHSLLNVKISRYIFADYMAMQQSIFHMCEIYEMNCYENSFCENFLLPLIYSVMRLRIWYSCIFQCKFLWSIHTVRALLCKVNVCQKVTISIIMTQEANLGTLIRLVQRCCESPYFTWLL